MELLVLGGDMRYACLAERAAARGIGVMSYGLERLGRLKGVCACTPESFEEARYVLLSNPWQEPALHMPFGEEVLRFEQALNHFAPGAHLLCGGTDGMPSGFSEHAGLAVTDLYGDEAFAIENAVLTAEGAIHAAMGRTRIGICHSRCLVVGYGRIGSALARMLRGLNAQVTVAARRRESRALARADGFDAVDLRAMLCVLPAQHLIFSTPPQMVLALEQLKEARQGALIIDLASPPYGVDLDAAQKLGLTAWREPGLPGRYSPESAAEVLLETVLAAMNR